MWGQAFRPAAGLLPDVSQQSEERRLKSRRQDEILTPHRQPALRTRTFGFHRLCEERASVSTSVSRTRSAGLPPAPSGFVVQSLGMETLPEPFALTLYRRVLEGETVRQLSESLSIPEERVSQRVRVAARFWEHHKARVGLAALGAELDRDRPL